MTLADTIREALQRHMDSGGVVMGQNLGEGLGGTVPIDHKNLLTLPTSDCSNAGVAVGHALAGRRPVLVVRFQGLAKVGLWPVLEYAGKSKELWGRPCPVFIRAVAREGGIGPVCSGAQHGLAMRCPGVKVVAPMTPTEWTECWDEFMAGDDPMYCSEWNSSWELTDNDLNDEWTADRTKPAIYAMGQARVPAMKAAKASFSEMFDVWRLKPLPNFIKYKASDKVLVVDCEPQTCGAAEHVAMELHHLTGAKVRALALDDRAAGFSPESDVLTPGVERIVEAVKELEE